MGPRPGSFLSTKPCAWHMARAQQILIWDMNELILQWEKQVRIRGKAELMDSKYEALQKALAVVGCVDRMLSVFCYKSRPRSIVLW